MTQNEHVYAICCRQEVPGDVISGRVVKTVEDYVPTYFEVASSSILRENKSHCNGEDGGGCDVNAICS